MSLSTNTTSVADPEGIGTVVFDGEATSSPTPTRRSRSSNLLSLETSWSQSAESNDSDLNNDIKTSSETSAEQQSRTILFETGNPKAGTLISGTIEAGPVTMASSIYVVESVPGLMSSPEFCTFVSQAADGILYVRFLRLRTQRNQYIAVLKFKRAELARPFIKDFRGKPYLRGMTKDICTVRPVLSIRFDALDNDDSHPSKDSTSLAFPHADMFPNETADVSVSALPPADCTVCLDRMDAHTAALVTLFCNHTMHLSCLARWELSWCPVCRHTHELMPEASVCMKCAQHDGLWMCLVCAFVGCGFYEKGQHAHQHFRETEHPFATNLTECTFWSGDVLQPGCVWDYISERFVNRLVSSDDGKVVEVDAGDGRNDSSAGAASTSTTSAAVCCASAPPGLLNVDDVTDREVQAAIYASRMDADVNEYRRRLAKMEADHSVEKEQLGSQIRQLRKSATEATKERKALVRKLADSEREMKSMKDKNHFLKSLNEALLRDKQAWDEEVKRMKSVVAEAEQTKQALQEQLRDLMLHLETQSKIANAPASTSDSCRSDAAELRDADVIRVGPSRRERLAMKANRRCSQS